MSNLNYFDWKGRTLIAVLLFVLISLNASAGSGLKFKDQKFKIIQFTDLHYVHSDKHKAQNDSTIELMRLLIQEEKPDLVVFTGDVVVSSPALAFFHIPLPEYAIVREQEATLGNNTERVHAPTMNTGLLSAFVEMNDVKGVFVGHDHNNDFIGGIFGVALAYGRKTGYVPAYTEILDRGARVIELTEGADFFETYIRTRSDKLLEYTFPY